MQHLEVLLVVLAVVQLLVLLTVVVVVLLVPLVLLVGVVVVLVVLTGINVHVELGADGAKDEAAGRTEHQRGEEDCCKE